MWIVILIKNFLPQLDQSKVRGQDGISANMFENTAGIKNSPINYLAIQWSLVTENSPI